MQLGNRARPLSPHATTRVGTQTFKPSNFLGAAAASTGLLYEGYSCRAPARMSGRWTCGSGAIFSLSSGKLVQRPLGWTSADGAGLPIWPGLITTREVGCVPSVYLTPKLAFQHDP